MTGALSQRPRALPAAQCSVALLVVLVAHLALMASPFHAPTMDPGGGVPVDVTAILDGDMLDLPMGAMPCLGSSTNCTIEWTPASNRLSLDVLGSPAPVGGPRLLVDQAFSLGPSPQAHGPPRPTSLQALLQVFRI